MADGLASGLTLVGSFTPIQLWAGEPNGQTTQGVAAAGFQFGSKNTRGETNKFPVVALVDEKLVPWDPAAATGAEVPYGILPHALDTTAAGYNADVDTPVFISGHPSFDALSLPVGITYAEVKAAFAGTMINVQKLL